MASMKQKQNQGQQQTRQKRQAVKGNAARSIPTAQQQRKPNMKIGGQ